MKENSKTVPQKESARRKRKRWPLLVIVFLLLGVLGFSGYKVLSGMNKYREGDAFYEDLAVSAATEGSETAQSGSAPAEKKVTRKINRSKIEELPEDGSQSGESSGEEEQLEEIEVVDLSINYSSLSSQNGDIAGWIYCEGTPINYPIVRGSNNDFYLDHRFDGVYSIFGSIFIDCRCPKDFSAEDTLIYGHHMDNGSMFAAIVNYKSQSYYNAHPTMLIDTPSGDFLLELFAGYTAATDDVCYSYPVYGGSRDTLIDHALAMSTFQSGIVPSSSDRIVTLSTCAYDFKNARYVVLGVLTPLL